ncbi:MAG: peptidase S41 [Planctomycetes bacterium]|nr:peptidase S41 [Planctomycetota bacterium]
MARPTKAKPTPNTDVPRGETQGATLTLPQFLAQTGTLTAQEREQLVDQAEVMLEKLYVHLPLKRSMHAVDPVQRLKLLRFRLSGLSERRFHDELIRIFTDLRDLHTNYILPRPYQTKTAFLPFLVEEYSEGSTRRYLVSKTFAGFTHPTFKPGVTLTSWSGVPIERAVELNADRQAGSNADARHARGLEALTLRTMAMAAPPDEEWVLVGYVDGAVARELRLDWQVFEPEPGPTGGGGGQGAARASLGLDLRTELARRAKKALFNPGAMAAERSAAARPGGPAATDAAGTSLLPDAFAFREVTTPSGKFGYIRIWTFMVKDDNAFVAEFVRMAGLLPKTGLIVDVRGNGGGNILCAEKLLQVLTPRPVEPTLLSFVNSPLTLQVCRQNEFVAAWAPSISQSVETGEGYSRGFPILPAEEYNRLGQRYQGPVVLITDPLCYSATDIFAAGFQDNQIGPILSAGGRTGAGGANVWDHELLRQVLPGPTSPFSALPKGASFRVAIRRVIRAGTHRGVPLEDLGVEPDQTHRMTKGDLLQGNVDLLAKAGTLLAGRPRVSLDLIVGAPAAGKRKVTLTTQGLDRVDLAVDGRPRATLDVTDGSATAEIPHPGGGGHDVAARGFKGGGLKAVAHAAV